MSSRARAEEDAAGEGQGAAGKAGAGAAGDDRDPEVGADRQDGANLVGGSRQGDDLGQAAVGGERIAFVDRQPFAGGDQAIGGQDGGKAPHQHAGVRVSEFSVERGVEPVEHRPSL